MIGGAGQSPLDHRLQLLEAVELGSAPRSAWPGEVQVKVRDSVRSSWVCVMDRA